MPSKLAILMFLLASVARADVVHLKDGRQLQGEVKRSGDGWIVIGAGGIETFVSSASVASIEAVRSQGSADSAISGLQSLRRSVENMNDLKQIIARYKSFVDAN